MSATVVLTQAAEGSDSLARELTTSGLRVERWPLVRLSPVALAEIAPVLSRLADYNWIFLPSPSAVRLVAGQMKELGLGWPAGARAGLVGPASIDAFRECFGDAPGVDSPAQPPHDARHLVATLGMRAASTQGGQPLRVLVLNRPDGRTQWIEALREQAASVDVVAAYTATPLQDGPPASSRWRLEQAQRSGAGLAWVVGASSHLDTLSRGLPVELANWAKRQPMLVPHAAIRQHARDLGFENVIVYDDRRDLVERLQYLRNSYATEHAPPAVPADKEGISVLSLDQQKSSAIPGARLTDEQVTDAKVVSESPPGAVTPPPPDSSSAQVSASAPASAPSSGPPAPPAGTGTAGTGTSRPPFSSPAPRAPEPPFPPSASPPPPPPPPDVPPGPLRGASSSRGGLWALLLLLLVGALAAGGWWYTQQRFLAAERDGARRVQEAEARAARLEEQIKSLRDSQSQLLSRSSTLESRIAESATQQEQLATLYDEIAKTRGDGTLAAVEQSVTMATQHLELTGNVQAALLALENAERRLGNSEQSQAIGARRLILQDIERLRALPEVDLTRLAARLDEIINRVDRLPLMADANQATAPPPAPRPSSTASSPPSPGAASTPDASPSDSASTTPAEADKSALQRLYASVIEGGTKSLDAVREEFRSLVTIRRIDKPDSLLLSPEQKHSARENLKLLLLNARLNLLNRHEELFRQDLARVVESMQRLYDTEQHDVKTAIATLQNLQSQPLALNLPSLSESLAAVRAARAASEKRS